MGAGMNGGFAMRGAQQILIVDDDGDVRASLAQALEGSGRYSVRTAADGFEAGICFGVARPDLVILDLVMPGMGGLDLCRQMRRLGGGDRLKVIVMTGYPVAGTNERSLFSGADLFLTKPQDIAALLTHIADLLDG